MLKILRFKIIHHGVIPLKTKNDNSLKKILMLNQNVLKIGMLAREKNKGHYDFIDAFYLLPKLSKDRFRIFFIGPIDNNEFKKIKNRLKDLSLENYFKITGFIKSKSLNILINLDLLFH